MDESIEVGDSVWVKVIDYIDGIFGCDALVFLYLAELEMFELVEK